jgi:hypothetical protein
MSHTDIEMTFVAAAAPRAPFNAGVDVASDAKPALK